MLDTESISATTNNDYYYSYPQHENICKFPSKQFYNDLLIADDSVKKRPPVTALRDFWPAESRWPILFCDVVEDEKEFYSSTEEDTEIDDTTFEKFKKEIILLPGKKSEKLRREKKTDTHSKFNPGQAKIAVSFINIMFIALN